MVYRGLVDQFNGTLEVFLNAEANVTFEIAYALRQEGIGGACGPAILAQADRGRRQEVPGIGDSECRKQP